MIIRKEVKSYTIGRPTPIITYPTDQAGQPGSYHKPRHNESGDRNVKRSGQLSRTAKKEKQAMTVMPEEIELSEELAAAVAVYNALAQKRLAGIKARRARPGSGDLAGEAELAAWRVVRELREEARARTMTITLKNALHHTSHVIHVKHNRITREQIIACRKALCPVEGCLCGDIMHVYGKQTHGYEIMEGKDGASCWPIGH